MTPSQAFATAAIQGATELFPVSSLGHAVIVPWLLGWDLNQQGATFLPFLVMLHVGTAAALLAYFWRDWWSLACRVLGAGPPGDVTDGRRLAVLIVVATLPAVLIGGALEHTLRRVFATPSLAAIFLIANGAMLIAGDRLRLARPAAAQHRPIGALTAVDAVVIGLWQCLALLPGLSRSGATMVGALLRGVDHEDAAHFSFLIAFPIILAATVLEVPKLAHAQTGSGVLQLAILSAVIAGVIAFLSTAILMRYFRQNDRTALTPFAVYCILAGAGALVIAVA